MKLFALFTLLICALAYPITSLGQANLPCATGADIPSCFDDPNVSDHDLKQAIDINNEATRDVVVEILERRQIRSLAESVSQSIQNGGGTLSSAATSLVSKSLSTLLGIAEESGAVSSTTSGSTTTLTANVQQIVNIIGPSASQCYFTSLHCTIASRSAQGGTIAVSLNSSAQTSTTNLSNASSAALAALSGVNNPTFSSLAFKENLHGRRRPTIKPDSFTDAIAGIDVAKKKALLDAYQALVGPLLEGKGDLVKTYNNAMVECLKNLRTSRGNPKQVTACRESFADVAAKVPEIDGLIKNFIQAELAYNVAREAALKDVFFDTTYSLEYDLTNNANQPMTSTFKGIYGYQHQSKHYGVLETTANGSATIYNSLQGSSESRLRSAQGALQFDLKPDSQRKIQPEFSAGYYFQYMVADGLVNLPSTAFAPGTTIPLPSNASELLNTTGPIHIGQGKLTLSIKGTNIKIPLAITGASRTDLVKANKVSGNFGISYDFSSLFSKQ